MKLIDSSKEKVKKICDVLVRDTLQPAQKKADEIIEEARGEAEKIIKKARAEAAGLIQQAEQEIDEKRRVFESSLKVAIQKGLTDLRDQIENHLFHPELTAQIQKYLLKKEVIAHLIDALVEALSKEGMSANLEVIVSSLFKPEEICAAILASTADKLKNQTVQLDDAIKGVAIRCQEKRFSIDITEGAVKEVLARYATEGLRKVLFKM